MFRNLVATLRRFAIARNGAAAVEFALITPFLLTLYMGSIELSDLIAVDRRITVVASTVADLVARTDGNLPSTDLTDFFKASEGIILPYSKTALKQVVTLVAVNNSGVGTVSWSRGYNGGTALTTGAAYTLPSAMSSISHNNWVIVAETYYSYKPLLGWVVKNAISLHRVSYYLPRYGANIPLT